MTCSRPTSACKTLDSSMLAQWTAPSSPDCRPQPHGEPGRPRPSGHLLFAENRIVRRGRGGRGMMSDNNGPVPCAPLLYKLRGHDRRCHQAMSGSWKNARRIHPLWPSAS